MDELISVIIPVHNVENYIERCLSSVIKQTYTNIEIIVIIDGCTDKSEIICKKIADSDLRIKIIRQRFSGVSVSRNTGLDNANGDYIFFVDSDDEIHETIIEYLYKNLKKYNCDISVCEYQRVENSKQVVNVDMADEKITLMNNVEAIKNQCYKTNLPFIVCWSKLYKKELFSDIRYPIGKIHEDEFITYKILYKCSNILHSNLPLYYYYRTPKSIMEKEFNIKRLDIFEAMKEKLEFLKENNQIDLYKYTLHFVVRLLIMRYVKPVYDLKDKDITEKFMEICSYFYKWAYDSEIFTYEDYEYAVFFINYLFS